MLRLPRPQTYPIGDEQLRGVPALGFTDVPAFVRRREFGAHALPAGAGIEDDPVAIDQVVAACDDFGLQLHESAQIGIVRARTRCASALMRKV